MPEIRIRVAVPARAVVGEGPVWDERAHRLHWVDIPAGAVHTSRPDTGDTTSVTVPQSVGAVALTGAGALVLACQSGFGVLDGGVFTPAPPLLAAGHRMNDAECDPLGRFWAGSTAEDFARGRGAVHVLAPDWTHTVVLDGLTLPNGMAFSADGRTFYLADSYQRTVFAFDVDLATTTLSNRRQLIRFAAADGLPDGLCLDTDGCLWLAMWGGGRVLRISPDGRVLRGVPMPVAQPSSCAFGGEKFDTLYVTSARDGLGDLGDGRPDGSVFAVTGTGARGRPPARFAGDPAAAGTGGAANAGSDSR